VKRARCRHRAKLIPKTICKPTRRSIEGERCVSPTDWAQFIWVVASMQTAAANNKGTRLSSTHGILK